MRQSLYSILLPLLTQGREGWLNLTHEHGHTAAIAIKHGEVQALQKGSSQGFQVLKELALWLFFNYEFLEEPLGPLDASTGLDISTYLGNLKKVDEKSLDIQAAVPFDIYTYKTSTESLKEKRSFKPDELKVVLALDGKTSVKSIIKKTGIADLMVLAYIQKLTQLGIAERVELIEAVLTGAQATAFMAALMEEVTNYLGPAAGLVLDEAFEGFTSTPQKIYKKELPDLTIAIAEQLDGSDRVMFKKWSLGMIKKL